MELISEPLRVISKADHKRKGKPQKMSIQKQSTTFQQYNQFNQQMNQFNQMNSSPVKETKMPRVPEMIRKENAEHGSFGQMKMAKEIDSEIDCDDENSVMNVVYYQQRLLKEIADRTVSNSLEFPLKETLRFYAAIPQQQRIIQLMRFISNLPPEEMNAMNEIINIFRLSQTHQ